MRSSANGYLWVYILQLTCVCKYYQIFQWKKRKICLSIVTQNNQNGLKKSTMRRPFNWRQIPLHSYRNLRHWPSTKLNGFLPLLNHRRK